MDSKYSWCQRCKSEVLSWNTRVFEIGQSHVYRWVLCSDCYDTVIDVLRKLIGEAKRKEEDDGC